MTIMVIILVMMTMKITIMMMMLILIMAMMKTMTIIMMELQSLSHPANLRAVGCHRHCKMKTGSCKTSDMQLICKQ